MTSNSSFDCAEVSNSMSCEEKNRRFDSLYSEVWVTRNFKFVSAVFVLFLILKSISSVSFFESISANLNAFFSLLLFILAVIIFFFISIELLVFSIKQLCKKNIPLELCIFVATLLAWSDVLADFSDESAGISVGSLLFFMLCVAFERKFSLHLLNELVMSSNVLRKIFYSPLKRINQNADASFSEVMPFDLKTGDIIKFTPNDYIPCDIAIRDGRAQLCLLSAGQWLNYVYVDSQVEKVASGAKVESGEIIGEVRSDVKGADFYTYFKLLENRFSAYCSFNVVSSIFTVSWLVLTILLVLYFIKLDYSIEYFCPILAAFLILPVVFRTFFSSFIFRKMLIVKYFLQGVYLNSFAALEKISKKKNIILENSVFRGSNSYQVVNYQIIDTRVDDKILAAVLVSFFMRADNQYSKAIFDFFSKKVDVAKILDVENFSYYSELDFAGDVKNSHFVVGHEVYLIDSGVLVRSSEIDAMSEREDCESLYVAIGNEVVAKFDVCSSFLECGKKLSTQFNELKLPCFVYGSDYSNDKLNRLGFSKIDNFGDVNSIVYSTQDVVTDGIKIQFVSNKLIEQKCDITFLNHSLDMLYKIVLSSREWNLYKYLYLVLITVAFIGLIAFTLSCSISPCWAAFIACGLSVASLYSFTSLSMNKM